MANQDLPNFYGILKSRSSYFRMPCPRSQGTSIRRDYCLADEVGRIASGEEPSIHWIHLKGLMTIF